MSLSQRTKVILWIIVGLVVIAGGVLTYLQLTGRVKIWAATPAFTVTPQERNLFVGETKTTWISPAKKFEIVCSGYSFSKSPSKTVEIVGGTNMVGSKYNSASMSAKKFDTLTSTFNIKALAAGTARCVFSGIIPNVGKTKIPSLALNIYRAQSGGTGTGGTTGGAGVTTITTSPTSLNLRINAEETVYISVAGPVVTVKCSNGVRAVNGANVGGTITYGSAGGSDNVPNIRIKAAPTPITGAVCQLYSSATASGTPAGQIPVTTYDY